MSKQSTIDIPTAASAASTTQTATGYEPSNDEKDTTDVGSSGHIFVKREDTQPITHSRIIGNISGGLFGDTSIPSTLPTMPKLLGPTAAQYSDWKLKALGYFQTNGLAEVVTTTPEKSLGLAIKIDGGYRSET